MIIVRLALVWLCFTLISSARSAAFMRTLGRRKGSFLSAPIKYKRQTEVSQHPFARMDRSDFGNELYPEESSEESSMLHLHQKASVAEGFRNRLMACGLITTKSPERWRDRLVAELDQIITDIEDRCSLCKAFYDEPFRYELLRSLINPCPACCRKNAKKRLLLTLQKVLEKSLDNENTPEDGESKEESIGEQSETNGPIKWHFTDVPKTRNTRSTTELPIEVTTSGNITGKSQELLVKHKFRNQWWPPQNERATTSTTIRYNVSHSVSGANYSSHSSMDVEDSDPSSVHVINGQPVNSVHDFLHQYMNLVYGGQPGNEQRRQFFLDQLCRNATNGRIVLQCKDITGQRKVRSPAKELQTWNAGQSPNTASDVQRSLLFATTTMNAIQPDYLGGRSCWCFGRTNPFEQQWRGVHQ